MIVLHFIIICSSILLNCLAHARVRVNTASFDAEIYYDPGLFFVWPTSRTTGHWAGLYGCFI